jgi:hypothetical protein
MAVKRSRIVSTPGQDKTAPVSCKVLWLHLK